MKQPHTPALERRTEFTPSDRISFIRRSLTVQMRDFADSQMDITVRMSSGEQITAEARQHIEEKRECIEGLSRELEVLEAAHPDQIRVA